jgi:hypothetical protein
MYNYIQCQHSSIKYSRAFFQNRINIFFYYEKRTSLLQCWRCSCKIRSRRIDSPNALWSSIIFAYVHMYNDLLKVQLRHLFFEITFFHIRYEVGVGPVRQGESICCHGRKYVILHSDANYYLCSLLYVCSQILLIMLSLIPLIKTTKYDDSINT